MGVRSKADAKGCLFVLNLAQLLTPLSTQAYTPLLPLFFTDYLGKSPVRVGFAFMVMTMFAMSGEYQPPRTTRARVAP